MSKIKLWSIPNLLTCLNLFSGCLACVAAFESRYLLAFAFIVAGAIFDFFDGMAARLLRCPSPIGKELDSLADDISFGLAPSVVVFSTLRNMAYPDYLSSVQTLLPYVAFVIAVCSALRLAKFNIDERQTSSFVGMPTPANALFWVSLCAGAADFVASLNPLIVLAGVLLMSWLLVAEIPMFALKVKSLSLKDNKVQYLFLVVCVPLVVIFKWASLSVIIVWYVLLSLATVRRTNRKAAN